MVKSVDLGQDREVVLDVSPRNQVEPLGIARMQRGELAKALLPPNPVLILEEPAALTPTRSAGSSRSSRDSTSAGVTVRYRSPNVADLECAFIRPMN